MLNKEIFRDLFEYLLAIMIIVCQLEQLLIRESNQECLDDKQIILLIKLISVINSQINQSHQFVNQLASLIHKHQIITNEKINHFKNINQIQIIQQLTQITNLIYHSLQNTNSPFLILHSLNKQLSLSHYLCPYCPTLTSITIHTNPLLIFVIPQMSFNDFKNNASILKKYLLKMNLISQSEIKPQWIQQNFLKENNPHIFLQILHYVLIKFSPSILFVKVLDFYPTIKDDHDKKFVTNALSFGRKMFQMDAKIDIDNFLSPKFVQKKTQFMSSFCKAAFQYHQKQAKPSFTSKIGEKGKKQSQSFSNAPKGIMNNQVINQESDEQNPRNLNLVPSNTRKPVIKKEDMEESSQDEDLKELMNKKKQLSKIKDKNTPTSLPGESFTQKPSANKRKQNLFPKNMQKFDQDQNDFIPTDYIKNEVQKPWIKYNVKTQKPKAEQRQINKHNNFNSSRIPQVNANDNQNGYNSGDYVTREQFMVIVSGMTDNFSQLLNKFNDFQIQVSGWVQNVNAKISILEENVKTIKNNL